MPRNKTDAPTPAQPAKALPDIALPAAFSAALGALPGGDLPKRPDAHSRPDQLNKARRPSGGPNRTAGPRRGHR